MFLEVILIVCVSPIILLINNKTKNDKLMILIGLLIIGFYHFVFNPDPYLLWILIIGIVFGFITDTAGVYTKKWRYRLWDDNFDYSIWVGFFWGIVMVVTYQIGMNISLSTAILCSIPLLWGLERAYGKTETNNYLFIGRTVFTLLASIQFLPLFFVSVFSGIFIEFAGTHGIPNWKYTNNMSFIFIGTGYALMMVTCKFIADFIMGIELFIPSVICMFCAILLAFTDYSEIITKRQVNEVVV